MNKKTYILVLILLFILISICYSMVKLETNYYEIKNSKIPHEFDGFKILHLSDLHNGKIGKNNGRLVKKINSINPDIIVMTGDMVDVKYTKYEVIYNLVKQLNNAYPIYYIYGNHEMSLSKEELNTYMRNLKELNVTVLRNEKISIEKNGGKINIYGLDFKTKTQKKDQITQEEIVKNLAQSNNDEYNILLTHDPLMLDIYSSWGADLVLSGHVHGGNIRLPFVGGVFSPDISFFPKYSKGMYVLSETRISCKCGIKCWNIKG